MDHYQNREYLEALPHFAEARRLDRATVQPRST